MIPAGAHERLATHVDAVLDAASVPLGERDDLAEELLGHLVERCAGLIGEGLDPDEAASRAIAEFGAAVRIGRDLTRAYRGRLWASTIGVLLPNETRSDRPMAVTLFAVQAFALSAIYVGTAGWALLNHPPVQALLLGLGASATSSALLVLGFGLLRAQRWALAIAAFGSIVIGMDGVIGFTEHTIRLSAILAALGLAALALEFRRVLEWLDPTPAPRWPGAILAGLLCLPLAAPVASAVPDPTQATSDDLDLVLSLDCEASQEVRSSAAAGDRQVSIEPAIVITVDIRWSRASLFPGGIADGWSADDVIVGLPDEWTMWDAQLVDPGTGQEVPGAGGLGPGRPDSDARRWSASIPREELRPGRTIRFEITMLDEYIGPRSLPLPTEPIAARYWHANKFSEERTASCRP